MLGIPKKLLQASHHASKERGTGQAQMLAMLTRVLCAPEEALPAAATPGAGASPGAPS